MSKLNLSNLQRRELQRLVTESFTPDSLQFALNLHLGRNMWNHSDGSAAFPHQVLQIISAAEREWWSDDLLYALRSANNRDLDLFNFAEDIGVAARSGSALRLQRLVTDAGFLDLPLLIQGLTLAEQRLCRVEVRGYGTGTGFLVGPDLVLTNHHVVAALIGGAIDSGGVRIRFDYKELVDGTNINPGTVFPLDQTKGSGVLFALPPSPLDEDADQQDARRDPNHLDVALLHVDGSPGGRPIRPDGSGGLRGWFSAPAAHVSPAAGDRLVIVQHPSGAPMAVDIGEVDGYSAGRLRMRYTANTQGGSSGAPCFDRDMRLVAVHHAGDPALSERAGYNAGIPIQPIRERLHSEGFTSALTPE